jgi:prepilin-type N-terminal cleavage/methylation domain-containing protein
MFRTYLYKKGFTLIEALIVIAILGVMVSVSVVAFKTFKTSQGLDKDTELVIETLQQARTQTLSSQNASQYGVHFASSTVTLFTGNSYSAVASTNLVYPFYSADTVLSTSLAGGGADVVFARLTGETTQNGTITIASSATTTYRTVTIYKTGLVEFK